jgi:hypothetical protein
MIQCVTTGQTIPPALQLSIEDCSWEYLPLNDGDPSPARLRSSAKENTYRPPSSPKETIASPVPSSPDRRHNLLPTSRSANGVTTAQGTNMLRDRHDIVSKASKQCLQGNQIEVANTVALFVASLVSGRPHPSSGGNFQGAAQQPSESIKREFITRSQHSLTLIEGQASQSKTRGLAHTKGVARPDSRP